MSEKSVFENAPRALYTAGIIILMLCSGEITENKLGGTLVAYSFIIVGMLAFTTLLVQNGKVALNSSSVMSIGPFFMFMVIIIMLISAISSKFNKIVQGHVGVSFSGMMYLQNILIGLILIAANRATATDDFKKSGAITEQYGAGLWFMNVLSAGILATIYIILFVYPTDGFVSMSGL